MVEVGSNEKFVLPKTSRQRIALAESLYRLPHLVSLKLSDCSFQGAVFVDIAGFGLFWGMAFALFFFDVYVFVCVVDQIHVRQIYRIGRSFINMIWGLDDGWNTI